MYDNCGMSNLTAILMFAVFYAYGVVVGHISYKLFWSERSAEEKK